MKSIDQLTEIMAQLRDPESGCPWDRQQSFKTIAPYTIEEAYEVADAIQANDMEALEEELGDLLFQVIYHSQLGSELGKFTLDSVTEGLIQKMISRHPHVFGNEKITSANEQSRKWQQDKKHEKNKPGEGVLSGVSHNMPAMIRARKLQEQAASVGFDWSEVHTVVDKLQEEINELKQEITNQSSMEKIEDELGDILFSCVNLSRHLKSDAEYALTRANRKFEKRFGYIEQKLAEQGKQPGQASLEEMDKLWEMAKNH